MYTKLAIEIGSWLNEIGLNVLLEIEFSEEPKMNEIKDIVENIKKTVTSGVAEKKEIISSVNIIPLPEYLFKPLPIDISLPENIEFVLSQYYARFAKKGLEVKDPRIIVFKVLDRYNSIVGRLKEVLEKAYKQLNSVDSEAYKVVYVDVSEVVGKPIIQLPELIHLRVGPEVLLGRLEEFVRLWIERHSDVDAIILTNAKMYIDPFGFPYSIVLENKPITSYIAPGWTMLTQIIPFPKESRPEELVDLGIELKNAGYYNIAMNYYLKAIEMNPQLKQAYNNLGKLLTDLSRPDEAIKFLDKALEIDPNYVHALINKGIALARMGRYYDALNYLDKVLKLDPNNPKAWYNTAVIYGVLGNIDKARECVSRALALDPNYDAAKQLKNFLEIIKNMNKR